jgi:hypothetical protein
LNAAQSTAQTKDMRSQVDYLYASLTSGEYGAVDVVMNDTWKHLTIFIGSNDVGGACRNTDAPEKFEEEMNFVLEDLHKRIPKLIVSLISLPRFGKLRKLEPTIGWCSFLHIFVAECKCVLQGSDEDRKKV